MDETKGNARKGREGGAEEVRDKVPDVRRPLAVLCSDIHLSDRAPVARSAEPDWLEAQGRVLDQVKKLCDKDDIPLIVAGDLFDKWNPSPAVVNMAMERLPSKVFAVPGQHDLRHHNYEDRHCTAYWTLVKAKRITDLPPGKAYLVNKDRAKGDPLLFAHGFPWGHKVKPLSERSDVPEINLAVIHAYCWAAGHSYPNAPNDKTTGQWSKRLMGYDAAVFGDNHKGFLDSYDPVCPIYNCGALIRRKQDERQLSPGVGFLYADKPFLRPVPLNTSGEKWLDPEDYAGQRVKTAADFSDFLAELAEDEDVDFDFAEVVRRRMNEGKVSKAVRKFVLEALEGNK